MHLVFLVLTMLALGLDRMDLDVQPSSEYEGLLGAYLDPQNGPASQIGHIPRNLGSFKLGTFVEGNSTEILESLRQNVEYQRRHPLKWVATHRVDAFALVGKV